MDMQSVEIAGSIAVALASLRIIERLIDHIAKGKNGGGIAARELREERIATAMREIAESQQAMALTLERVADRIEIIDKRTKETGSTVYEVRENQRINTAIREKVGIG